MKNNISTIIALAAALAAVAAPAAFAKQPIDGVYAHPPIQVYHGQSGVHENSHGTQGSGHGHGGTPPPPTVPPGLSPQVIKSIYNISGSGAGTIAIIDAYANPYIESDLGVFDTQYGLPACTASNGCLEVHPMSSRISNSSSWGLEESLDVQWAHAIAPGAKILLVEARSNRGSDLLAAVNYASQRADVVAVSMSWSAAEFSGEQSYDSYFTSPYGAAFFAASGDAGTGVGWPAVSDNVTGVGGTTLNISTSTGALLSETAWSGSGGGLSQFEPEPSYQTSYGVPQANSMRAVPDVSYDADPASGVSVYDSYGYGGWIQVGGTSAGAPQWAAIRALDGNVSNVSLYADAAGTLYAFDFRDILSGANGTCGYYCTAQTGYDYVTGLGSPLTVNF